MCASTCICVTIKLQIMSEIQSQVVQVYVYSRRYLASVHRKKYVSRDSENQSLGNPGFLVARHNLKIIFNHFFSIIFYFTYGLSQCFDETHRCAHRAKNVIFTTFLRHFWSPHSRQSFQFWIQWCWPRLLTRPSSCGNNVPAISSHTVTDFGNTFPRFLKKMQQCYQNW